MCFIIDESYPSAKTATKDIRAYKLLEFVQIERNKAIGNSPCRDFKWEEGKKIKLNKPLKINKVGRPNIEEGLHAYLTLKWADDNLDQGETICEFIIPKGSTYYINVEEYGEIVSNCMYWTGRIHTTDRWKKMTAKTKIVETNFK
jgi:hypothetical protein